MSLPNAITLSRIPAMFVIAALMFATWPGAATLAFWLFIAAAVGDWLDGHIARTRGLVSTFGKLMDAMADKIMVMGIVVALVEKHQINLMLALVVLCREFLVTGMRMVAATKGVVVAADSGGKTKTLTLLIALGFYLGAPMLLLDGSTFFHWDASRATGYLLTAGGVFFIAGTLLSVWSGTRYFVRNAKVVFAEEAALP
ncbi:MAG TPA: CDP-diacylglycerol--glycerol-3-phosphate 3-phosphatidyltransferase [Opitutaceae bacterium]|jgi:CDP-diacylglycerol--glycerol-3-phosphate 3-phosphatidyltransferase